MSDDEEPDFDINNYGIDELLQIFGINSPIKKGAIMKIAAEFIEKYKKLKQSSYVEFFSQAMNKLVSNYNLVEGILGKVDEIMEDVIDNKEKIEDLIDNVDGLLEDTDDFINDAKGKVDDFLNPSVEDAGPNVLKNRYYNGQTGPERIGKYVMPNRGNYVSVPQEGVSAHAPQIQQRLMLPNAFAQIPFAQGYRNPTLQNVFISWINIDSQYREIKPVATESAQCDPSQNDIYNFSSYNKYEQHDSSTDFLFTLQTPMTNVMAITVGSIEIPLAGYYAFSNNYGNTTFELIIEIGSETIIECLRIPEGNYDIEGISDIINSEIKKVFDLIASSSGLVVINPTYPTLIINKSNQKSYIVFYPENPVFSIAGTKVSFRWYNRDKCGCCPTCCNINHQISTTNTEIGNGEQLVDKPKDTFNRCEKQNTGKKINSTLGWSLGFREEKSEMQTIDKRLNIVADISINEISGNTYVGVFSSGVWNELGTKYLILEVDDFNHNRNSGVMGTMTMPSSTNKFKLPKYAKELSQIYPACDASGSQIQQNPPDIPNDEKGNLPTNKNIAYENFKRPYRKGTPAEKYGIKGQDTLTKNQKYTIRELRGAQKSKTVEQYYAPQSSDILFRFPVQRLSTNQQAPLIIPNAAGMDNGRRYFGPTTIEKLRIKLLDDKGFPVDLNGGDISFSLIFERLYQY